MVPILEDPKRVVAVGGIVRVLNGSEVEGGQLRRVRLPRKSIEAIQVIEYLRAFLIGREAWAQGNMLMIISGAFGLFRTDLVRAVGGYRARSIGEDFDLVARLHRHLLEKGADYEIRFVPDPMCWTEVPDCWNRNDYSGSGPRCAQQGILSAIPALWVCVRHCDFHGLRAPGGNHLQALQRLERCGAAGELLLPRTFSLPAITHDLAAARPLAIPARRQCLETSEAQGHGVGESSIGLL